MRRSALSACPYAKTRFVSLQTPVWAGLSAEGRLSDVVVFANEAARGRGPLAEPFQQMVADAQEPKCPFQVVIVYDVKRFGRLGNDEAGYYRHVLSTHGVEVRYVTENFNGDSTDDLLRPVKQWQARQESKDLSNVTIRGQLSRVEWAEFCERLTRGYLEELQRQADAQVPF